jgi:hypothetical protein
VSASPIEQLLACIDRLDLDAVIALLAPGCDLLTVDGRRADSAEGARAVLGAFLAQLRSTTHVITSQWHLDGVWLAEVEAAYELQDWLRIDSLPRAFVVRTGPDGITGVHCYGAHESRLSEHDARRAGISLGAHWIPAL